MMMGAALRRLVLTTHVATSVGLLGAVASFLALALTGLFAQRMPTIEAVYIAMDIIARLVIVPLAFAALLIGVVQSWYTPWGLFRHYWVIAKLVLTLLVIIILLMQLGSIAAMAQAAADRTIDADGSFQRRLSLAVHAGAGLIVLLVSAVLSIYKPRGVTRYGRARG
jgi:hypothetical protein